MSSSLYSGYVIFLSVSSWLLDLLIIFIDAANQQDDKHSKLFLKILILLVTLGSSKSKYYIQYLLIQRVRVADPYPDPGGQT